MSWSECLVRIGRASWAGASSKASGGRTGEKGKPALRSGGGAQQGAKIRDHTIAAATFRVVERIVRRLDQIGSRLRRLRHHRLDADADRDLAERRFRMIDPKILDGFARFEI